MHALKSTRRSNSCVAAHACTLAAGIIAILGLCAGTGCNLQQLASEQIAGAVSQGLSQAGVQLGGVDVQGVVNSFLASNGTSLGG